MKKFLTLKNIVLCSGALLLLVAFFLSFGATAHGTNHGVASSYDNIVWGCNSLTIDGVKHPLSELMPGLVRAKPAALQLTGIILMLVAAIGAALVALLVKKPWAKWIVVGLAVVAVAGAVFQFFALQGFVRGMVNAMAENLGITDKEAIEQEYKEFLKNAREDGVKITMNIVMGVLGIIGGLAVGASQFLPEKK